MVTVRARSSGAQAHLISCSTILPVSSPSVEGLLEICLPLLLVRRGPR